MARMKNNNQKKDLPDTIISMEKEIEREVILNVPNTLTFIRLILGFVLIYLILFTQDYLIILIVFAIAAITDFFDGYFARKLKQTTKIGARLDQVIDRIFMIPILIILIIKFFSLNPNMAYLSILCLTREFIGAPGFIIRIVKNSDPYKVKFIGKFVTFVQSLAVGAIMLSVILPQLPFITISAWILAIVTGLSGILAGVDYLRDSLK